MVWTEITRAQHDRPSLRYAGDCTQEEWALIAPFMPPAAKVGRPRQTDLRAVWNAIQYIASTGCQWAQLPKEFPPFTTVQYYFYQLRDSGAFDAINETLVMAARLLSGRKAEPTAGFIDSQSVRTTESGGVCGYDAGKKIKGRKRHIVRDTEGHLLAGLVHPADIQDRDGAVSVIADMRASFPAVTRVFADGGYGGDKLAVAMLKTDGPQIQIVKRPDRGTSRNVLSIIEASGETPVVIEYLKEGWSRPQLLALFAAASLTPRAALRELKSPAKELVLDLLDRMPPGPLYKEDGEMIIEEKGIRLG